MSGTSSSKIAGAGAGNNGLQSMPPDLFVIVRPPPSKQTHPLNLQIQLINPNAARSATTASSSSRTSGEYSRNSTPMDSPSSIGANSFDAVAGASVGGGGLQRTPSVKSNRSGRSQTSSAGSAFSGNGGRRVQPLYNLDFHALLPTVVTDAGTDQKVAKFLKRGVEIIGLAILDPIDLATPPPTPALSPSTSASSHPTPPPTAEPSPSSFLNRFKRLSFKPPSFTPPKAALVLSPSTSLSEGLSTTTPSGLTVLPLIRTASNSDPSRLPAAAAGDKVRGYAFTVRKWTRRDLEGTKEGAEAAGQVRFEWRRGRKKRATRRVGGEGEGGGRPKLERYASGSNAGGEGRPASPVKTRSRSRGPSPGGGMRRQDTLEGEDLTNDPNNLCAPNGRRRSLTVTGPGGVGLGVGVGVEGRGSRPTSMHSDMDHERTDGEEEDEGEESDPEDSERPWTCHLVQSVSGFSSSSSTPSPPLSTNGSSSSPPPPPPIKRIHLGTLIPAPHHPKLVATLSVPFSLSPLALGTPKAGGMWGASEGLSVEEMKDCLSVSCLWVVVREGLGGLGAGGVSKGAKWKLGR